MNDRSIVSLTNANIYQGKSLILSNVNFHVQKGEFVYLIGKTGTGKSSLLKTLYGDIYLQQGTGRVANFDLKTLKWQTVPLLRRNLGIVFQDFRLLTDRNVHDNLEFVLKATGWKDKALMKEKIENVLNKVGLRSKGQKMPYEMSGGEQQRIDIARALLNNPKLILADEPTGNLDPDTTDEIMQLLFNICRDYHTAFIMATHDYSIIQKYPARVVRIEQGQVKEISVAGM
ncbi:MAG: ATP-binding cassette domain-containing protein [Bacteroidetes bacterium]|nr:ATP-binding cassette domain-containing protein [Bacteroidota bacterium]MBS1740408.1 ATP-binding cassette domain-containing protein [Bacteroidota bacterium]MBS1774656.1 ATP-binding cassette domain-containing protein [Bacteroidota bacterium]